MRHTDNIKSHPFFDIGNTDYNVPPICLTSGEADPGIFIVLGKLSDYYEIDMLFGIVFGFSRCRKAMGVQRVSQ